jgi:hypothetical protein
MDMSRWAAPATGVEENQRVVAGHELLNEAHPTDPRLDNRDPFRNVAPRHQLSRRDDPEPIIAAQHVADRMR